MKKIIAFLFLIIPFLSFPQDLFKDYGLNYFTENNINIIKTDATLDESDIFYFVGYSLNAFKDYNQNHNLKVYKLKLKTKFSEYFFDSEWIEKYFNENNNRTKYKMIYEKINDKIKKELMFQNKRRKIMGNKKCRACGTITTDFHPVCTKCGNFNNFENEVVTTSEISEILKKSEEKLEAKKIQNQIPEEKETENQDEELLK